MCKDCRHWKRHEGYVAMDLVFAPCALKPDRVVPDRRDPRGWVEQAYATQDTYECGRYASR